MFRPFAAIWTRPGAIVTSVALHVGAMAVGGHALTDGADDRTRRAAPLDIEVQLAAELSDPPPAATRVEDERSSASPRSAGAGHHHVYPVPSDHDAHPHDASLVHLSLAASKMPDRTPSELPKLEPNVLAPLQTTTPNAFGEHEPSASAPPRFTLGATKAAMSGSVESGAGAFVGRGASDAAGAAPSDTIFAESAVDAPARLASAVPVAYPDAARAAGLEADVQLELVVDREGRVTSARTLSSHGLGLADAALRAVRGYLFHPARRAGRPVSVRMHWTVTFRLQ